MIRIETVPLIRDEKQEVLDLDITPTNGWIGVSLTETITLTFNGASVSTPIECAFPLIRSLSDGVALLVNGRTDRDVTNGWLIDSDGSILQTYYFGDAIADVVILQDHIAITHFDEAFGNTDERYGVCIYDMSGNQRVFFPTIDCYCACSRQKDELFTLLYPSFSLIHFNARTHAEEQIKTPTVIAGAKAMTCIQNDFYFHSSYRDEEGVYHWNTRSDTATRIASYHNRLRGISNGRFLSYSQDAYTILSITH